MSGHSKWHNIRLRKGKQDAERGKSFTKLSKEIIIAAKNGGGNPEINMRLRTAVDAARKSSMPNDTIKRAIQRGTGELEGVNYEELVYEGYGPGGVAVLCNCLTDNKNRTVSDVRSIFSKNGGRLGESGSVSYLFEPKGVIIIDPGVITEDRLMEIALEAGAEDVQATDDGGWEVSTAYTDFGVVRDALDAAKVVYASAEATMIPSTTAEVTGSDARQVLRMIDLLEEHDDVQDVYSNVSISDEELASL